MRFLRSSAFVVLVPLSVFILIQGCSSSSTGGSCLISADDGGSSGAGQCGNGPKQGSACCVSSTASCANQLPLCAELCCVAPSSEAGARETGTVVIDTEGGVVSTDARLDVAPADATSGACPGNTKQTAPFVNNACQSALEQSCCTELKSCFDIVPSGGSTDCNAYASCIAQCGSSADVQTCQNTCDSSTTPSVKTAYEAIVTCATNNASTSAACQ